MKQKEVKQDLETVESNKISEKILAPWRNHIELMMDKFDKELRIKWLPKSLSDFLIKFRKKNKIKNIYSHFGELRVDGDFTWEFEGFIREAKRACLDTCEFCGKPPSGNVMIKGWVRNCCDECKIKEK